MTCPELPVWFVLLATFGAVSGTALVLYGIRFLVVALWAGFLGLFNRPKATHVGQIQRRLFR